MHEFHIADGVVKTALAEAEKHGARRITALKLRLGGKSHITPEGMETCIEASARGTIAEGARIEIEVFENVYRCADCTLTFPAGGDSKSCPGCGSTNLDLFTGEEVYLDSLEVD